MRRGAAAVVGRVPIVPTSVSLGDVPYPPVGELLAEAGAWLGKMAALDLGALAEAAGERRAIGAVALGATAGLAVLPISADTLRQTTIELAPPRKRDQNAAAFDAGFRAVEDPKSAARRRH
jgi:Pyruvate/2-oxoacid:ferredoxin oxidoreductase gamma subunit